MHDPRHILIRSAPSARGPRPWRRAFTLIELLVVIAIIAIVSVLSVIAVGRLSQDARISGATNQVLAALDEARATAIRTNRSTAVVFLARWDASRPEDRQVTECVVVTWLGDQEPVIFNGDELADIFVAVPDVQPRRLPPGIKVGGPFYAIEGFEGLAADFIWLTQPELRLTDPDIVGNNQEFPGEIIGVLFDPKGSVVTSNVSSFAREAFYDEFLGDTETSGDGQGFRLDPRADTAVASAPGPLFYHYHEDDEEVYISFIPFLSVYDDDAARELKELEWTNRGNYEAELTGPSGYIAQFGRKIEFNKYTGVPLR
jgi:prepilin-type N-terminal cleavage/methylation domain-containing protein